MPPAVEPVALPPPYEGGPSVDDSNSDRQSVAGLPAYTQSQRPTNGVRQEPREFSYELKKKGKLFAVLTTASDATYSKHMPTFLEGKPLKGMVRLMLDKSAAISSVIVSAHGQFITGASQGEQLTFVDVSKTLWSQTEGEPTNINPCDGGSSSLTSSAPPKFTGKLQPGDYSWPFSIDLPKEVLVACGNRNEPQVFTLPQTFVERHTRPSIRYEFSVRFTRSKLRGDDRISAQFGFIPITRPPPFPPLRRLAYQEESPLLGPTVDPDGWHFKDSITIRGIFNNRPVLVGCTLFLAKPLSYTRGSLIPIFLRLDGDDQQALDLLSAPKAIVARLRRRIKYHHNSQRKVVSLAWRDSIDHSQLAMWWPCVEQSEQRGVRYVNGELHLRADIKPTSAMASFRVEYSVVLFSFDSPGLEFGSEETLLEQPVDIVTAFASGPRPRMSAPPGYESFIPVQQVADVLSHSVANLGFF